MLQGLRAKVTGALHAALGDDRAPNGAQQHQQQHLITIEDPRLARAEQLVAAATSAALPPETPDWGATLELVDMINADPPGATPLVLVPLHRVLATPPVPPTPNHASFPASSSANSADAATRRQLLSLATLEALVKNCRPQLHTALVNSPLWRPTAAEGGTGVLAAATAGSSSREGSGGAQTATIFPTVDVRDRALALVEDLARGLPHEPRFMRDYEALVDAGVDFPVRAVGEEEGQGGKASSSAAPYYSAPPEPTVAAATDANNTAIISSSSLTAADRAAITAAQAELEREAALRDAAALGGAAAEAGHHPGDAARLSALGPAAAWAGAIRPPGYAPPASAVANERAAAAAAAASGGDPATTTTTPAPSIVLPSTDAELRKATQVAANSAELLREMVGPLAAQAAAGEGRASAAAAREPLLADLADQCHRYRSLLQEAVAANAAGAGAGAPAAGAGADAAAASTTTSSSFTEEATAAALSANDDLQRALLAYEAVAAGRAVPPAELGSGGGGGGGGVGAAGAATAGAATAAAAAAATATTTTTPAAFTLGDDDDNDEDANDEGLASTRAAMAGLGVGGRDGSEARGGSK